MAHAAVQPWSPAGLKQLTGAMLNAFAENNRPSSDLPVVLPTNETPSVSYDSGADVLYFTTASMAANDVYEIDGIVIRMRRRLWRKPILVGITVMDASTRPEAQPVVDSLRQQPRP